MNKRDTRVWEYASNASLSCDMRSDVRMPNIGEAVSMEHTLQCHRITAGGMNWKGIVHSEDSKSENSRENIPAVLIVITATSKAIINWLLL